MHSNDIWIFFYDWEELIFIWIRNKHEDKKRGRRKKKDLSNFCISTCKVCGFAYWPELYFMYHFDPIESIHHIHMMKNKITKAFETPLSFFIVFSTSSSLLFYYFYLFHLFLRLFLSNDNNTVDLFSFYFFSNIFVKSRFMIHWNEAKISY